MYTNLPFMYEAEILDVMPQSGAVRKFVRYLCRVEIENGSHILVPNVEASTSFGGIADYFQARANTSQDSGQKLKITDQEAENARIGDRCVVAFMGGNIKNPRIITWLQHPNQTNEFDGDDLTDATTKRAVFQYNGIRFLFDNTGQFSIIHQGAPTVKDTGGNSALGAAAGAVSGAASALEGVDNPDLPDDNPAITPADTDGLTIMEFLDDGVWRLRDSQGQIIEVDHTKNRIYISNNDLKSTEDASSGPASGGNELASNSTDAEYVLLDSDKQLLLLNARKTLELYSFDARKDVTEGDYTSHVEGDTTWKLDGDETTTIDGDKTEKVSGAWKITVQGDAEIVSMGKASIEGSGGKFTASGEQIALGSESVELITQLLQVLQQLITLTTALQAETHIGNLGYPTSPPVNLASYSAVMTQLTTLQSMIQEISLGAV